MKETILITLKQMEENHHVKVLYACEAGSRSWGLAHEDSDYDVRFIYVHPRDYYLSIDPIGIGKKKDVIELPINDTLDIVGWELTKALRLFRKSNPSLLEWLHSEKVYYEAFSTIKKIKQMEETFFSAKPCIHHYLNMARNNYRKCLQTESMNIKLYINVLRPIILAKWIEENKEFPPMTFPLLLDEIVPAGNVKDSIFTIINLKKNIHSKLNKPIKEVIHPFIEKEITQLENYANKLQGKTTNAFNEPLDHLFRNTLNEVWGS